MDPTYDGLARHGGGRSSTREFILACLFCGKEIGTFRLLRDREFCCPAHRQGYSARLGKVLGAISAHEPPPAPLATFLPYKPFPGKNLTPSQFCTLESYPHHVQIPATWSLCIVPLGRERTAPLPSIKPVPLAAGNFAKRTQPQPWLDESRLPEFEMELQPEVPDFDYGEEVEPQAAGPFTIDIPVVDWKPETQSNPEPFFTVSPVQMPRPAALATTLRVCGIAAGLLADAVEAFLPPSPDPEPIAYESAAATLRSTLQAADWVVLADLASPAPGLTAQAVESYLPALPEPQVAPWPAIPALPALTLAAADWLIVAGIAEPVASPEAQPVEAFLPALPEPQVASWPATAALPALALAPTDWLIVAGMAEPLASPEAQPVEAFLPALAEPQILPWPTAAATLPRLTVDPIAWSLSVDLAGSVPAPAPQAVESWLPAASETQMTMWPAMATVLPGFTIAAADWSLEATLAEPVAAPAAEPVEVFLAAAAEPCALPMGATLRLPEFTLTAVAPELPEEFVPPVVIAEVCQTWMASPTAYEAVRDVIPAFARELTGALPVAAPAATLSLSFPTLRWEGDWRPSAIAEPVISFVKPHLEPALPISFPIPALDTRVMQQTLKQEPVTLAAPAAVKYPQAAAPAVNGPVIAASSEGQVGHGLTMLQFPALGVQKTTVNQAAPFQAGAPSAVEPAGAEPNPGAEMGIDPAAAVQSPAIPEAVLYSNLPLAKVVSSDFICQGARMAPTKSLEPVELENVVFAPKFVVRPIFERLDEPVAPRKPVEKTPAFAEIFAIRKAARHHNWKSHKPLFSAGKLIAASLIVGLSMWFGFGSVMISRQMLAINTTIHGIGSSSPSTFSPSTNFPPPSYSPAKAPSGPIASVRRAIQSRAAVEMTDTFRRMEAWGSNTLPAGWTRHPDGYVRTGQLALYRPAQNFSDYRFEFFGEIEKKSMSWAVRAHDPQNYYGMKMTVIEPGLRPVVALVHYAVVAGKKMTGISTPLNIMMHNNEAYHVAVDVKGNKVVTSVEGQEVDSWTDDALKVGGVGFFSEAGDSARLYWMKVTKNQDWLGRVCAYLSSGSGSNSAELWPGEMPGGPTQPSQPSMPPAADVTVAAAEEYEDFSYSSSQRARILKDGRTELCRS